MAKRQGRAKPRRKAAKHVDELFPDLPAVEVPLEEKKGKAERVPPATSEKTRQPSEAEVKEIFSDFGKQSGAQPLAQYPARQEPEAAAPVTAVGAMRETAAELLTTGKQQWRQLKAQLRKSAAKHPAKGKAHRPAAKVSGVLTALRELLAPHGKAIAITALCIVLFGLALFFAFNDMEDPTTSAKGNGAPDEAENGSATILTTEFIKVEWRGQQKLCTPEFLAYVLDGVEKLARRDGNSCAEMISLGRPPQECLGIKNVQYIGVQMRKFSGMRFNATCQSQDSFDSAVAHTYFEAFAKYVKHPDAGYRSPFSDVEDFLTVSQQPSRALQPVPPQMLCDAAKLREGKTELESRENVAAITGVVDESLLKLRAAVQEMERACARN